MTTTILGTIIKDGQTYEFNIEDSFAFKSESEVLSVFLDPDIFIDIIRGDKYFVSDIFITSNFIKFINNLINGDLLDKLYDGLKKQIVQQKEYGGSGLSRKLIINFDTNEHILNGKVKTFQQIRKDILTDLL